MYTCSKRKLPILEPIETVIICAQQNFEVAGGLNPIQIEIEDDRVLNMLKKQKCHLQTDTNRYIISAIHTK